MYQTIIRDPGGDGLIRIYPDLNGQYNAVVNGSILIVPPGTTAFITINGKLFRSYKPGTYEIFTGVDPFFVRLRNIMTNGDSGTSVSVFFISTERSKFLKLGTGEFPFKERRFQLTMKALASCTLSFSIKDPLKALKRLIGSYNTDFLEDDIEMSIDQLVLSPIKEALSREIGKYDLVEFNSHLSQIGNVVMPAIRSGLREYGLNLEQFRINEINITNDELSRLYTLEKDYADGKTRTDLELDNLHRVWNGNINNRTLSEIITGIPSRGQLTSGGNCSNLGGNSGGMMPTMMQMMILSQILPALREPLSNMVQHTDMFRNNSSDAQRNTSSADSPPSMPNRYKRCPSCNGNVFRNKDVCPICGYRFNERSE